MAFLPGYANHLVKGLFYKRCFVELGEQLLDISRKVFTGVKIQYAGSNQWFQCVSGKYRGQ